MNSPPHGGGSVRKSWWKGSRGEWLVVVQVFLMGFLFLGPRHWPGPSNRPFPFPGACRIVGLLLVPAGGLLFLAGIMRLGRGLTPLPHPKDNSTLIQTGPFALVRHPIYGGGIIAGLGWALCVQGWLTLGYAIVLFLFLDAKSRLEEKWLAQRFPDYADYQRRVHRLIPFLY
jgi:protein-S-isoprenylcysteine O-methyltransferase Ste14